MYHVSKLLATRVFLCLCMVKRAIPAVYVMLGNSDIRGRIECNKVKTASTNHAGA